MIKIENQADNLPNLLLSLVLHHLYLASRGQFTEQIHRHEMKFRSRKHSQDGPSASQLFVYYAARDGFAKLLSSALMDSSPEEIPQLVEQDMQDSQGQCLTPLIVASRNGHDAVVKILVSKFNANMEKEGCVKIENYFIEGATALWCAAGAGHLNVVKTLVKLGADVNHATETSSTPIRAACFDGRLDIVRFLVEHGADATIANRYNNTCLMIAAYKGHLEIVRYLLEVGVDPNEQAHCGATALLFAAERGYLEIVKELLFYGAKVISTKTGITPVLAAAERTRAEVVEHFAQRGHMSIVDQVDAFELLGASFANDNKNYCLNRAFQYLLKGMRFRSFVPGLFIPKPYRNPVPAYENWVESQNVEELQRIRHNENALHMESLTIRERILGPDNPEVPHQIIYRGAIFADNGRFDRCLELWIHALELTRGKDSIMKHLLRFAQIFSQMLHVGLEVPFHTVSYILRAAFMELERNKKKLKAVELKDDIYQIREDIENNLITALYLLVIISKMIDERTPEEIFFIKQLVYKLQKLKLVARNGQTLLHLCVNAETPVDNFHTSDVCRFPCATTAKLLIECGADLDALDEDRNSPLHIIVSYQKPISGFGTLHHIITDLMEAGAHPDIVNGKWETPHEAAATVIAEIVLRSQTTISLKCLTARAVKMHDIDYDETDLPCALLHFIELHGPNGSGHN